ncbi:MAG: hypothetical protein QG602_421 [Verrucomicrobiota bacterium]|nr:hypothetical protein [Verrucomicrobiota bacterium]
MPIADSTLQKDAPKGSSVWAKTSIPNLLKNAQSGRYYGRFTVSGKEKWVSLKTESFKVAKLRLSDHRAKTERARQAAGNVKAGEANMGELAMILEARIRDNVALAPRSKVRNIEHIKAVKRSWPGFGNLDPADVTRDEVEKYRNRVRREGTGFKNPVNGTGKTKSNGSSPGTINRLIDTIRAMLSIAVENGQLVGNPLAGAKLKLKLTPRKPELPEAAVLNSVYQRIEDNSAHDSADFCRLLNYSGMRVGEAGRLTWARVDWDRGIIKVAGTKTDSAERDVPMTNALRGLLQKLRARAEKRATMQVDGKPYVNPAAPVCAVREATVSLSNACAALGVVRLTHHDLRDAFATQCIEAGVDIPTVAAWLGHKDGGALLMKVYAHHRRAHSAAQAARVSF